MSIVHPEVIAKEPPCNVSLVVGNVPIPEELIAVAAYARWEKRCNEAGHTVHGYDQDDWFEAEGAIRSQLSSMTLVDMDIVVKRLLSTDLTPCIERVRTRAYFLAMNSSMPPDTPNQSEAFWLQAEIRERELLFAHLFEKLWNQRRLMTVFSE